MKASNVIDITDNFTEVIALNKPTLVKFFAPWCGHCKNLAPKFEELSSLVNADTIIAEVDCTRQQETCRGEEVRGYPTLRFYKNGTFSEQYSGPREAEALKTWIEEHSV